MRIHAGTDREAVTLSWNQTVDRRLVHRNALAEVLLTDIVGVAESSFEVAAQWSRSHRVYRPDADGRHDPMLILETIRQTGLALSHVGFDVPFGQRSVMHDIAFELAPDREPRVARAATNLSISVECVDVRLHHGALRTMTVLLELRHDGVSFATGRGTLSWMSVATFTALRLRNRPAPTAMSEAVGTPSPSRSRAAADALISAPDHVFPRRRLLIPLQHPVYFDHPLDHVPGLLLIDAVWQAASQLLPDGHRIHRCDMKCPAFTELIADTLVSLNPIEADVLGFEVSQLGRITTMGTLWVGPAT